MSVVRSWRPQVQEGNPDIPVFSEGIPGQREYIIPRWNITEKLPYGRETPQLTLFREKKQLFSNLSSEDGGLHLVSKTEPSPCEGNSFQLFGSKTCFFSRHESLLMTVGEGWKINENIFSRTSCEVGKPHLFKDKHEAQCYEQLIPAISGICLFFCRTQKIPGVAMDVQYNLISAKICH